MNLRREWPVFALLAAIAAFGLAQTYLGATYKAKFRPNYKNYEVVRPSAPFDAKDSGHTQGS
jgi:hypothetical protein